MAVSSSNSYEKDLAFLAQCEEEFKDRYTEKDEEFMKVFNAPDPQPPIMRSWYASGPPRQNHRNKDYNRRDRDSYSPYQRTGEQRQYNRNNHREHNSYSPYHRYDRSNHRERDSNSSYHRAGEQRQPGQDNHNYGRDSETHSRY